MMSEHGPATRPLDYLHASRAELWPLTDFMAGLPWTEWFRPAAEVWAATWMRAVYSRWQLREVVADFWHDHFHVAFFAGDQRVTPLLPLYDRDVIRKHAFGNFREFLEAVARSDAMLRYLNNASSRASPANENYARELFELHTLGADNYLNDHFANWREVPEGADGVALGYIDEDVYEAARAFTGWTIADGGETGREERLPGGGGFHYFDGWHDDYQKRVLGVELTSHQEPLADGRRILDLVAAHPATARNVCAKLCRHLVGGEPPPALVQEGGRGVARVRQCARPDCAHGARDRARPGVRRGAEDAGRGAGREDPLRADRFRFARDQRGVPADTGVLLAHGADRVARVQLADARRATRIARGVAQLGLDAGDVEHAFGDGVRGGGDGRLRRRRGNARARKLGPRVGEILV